MYKLIMVGEDGQGFSKFGKLPELLALGRQLHARTGMSGDIRRPDGTSIREHSVAWNTLFWLEYPPKRVQNIADVVDMPLAA